MKVSKNAFTLVELLVVISIMSILTIITISQFVTARMRARDVARKGDLGAMSKALQMYFADYGVFPATINGYSSSDAWGTELQDPNDHNYVYMKVLPKSGTAAPYCYVVDSENKKFGLFAMLENVKDSDCNMNGSAGLYLHCGGKNYCYSVVSPNAVVGDFPND
jgi:type II secretion system protein G